ncbi:MAG: carbohydrate binding domain-containing protein, partial [Anaerolineae bacterium]|nr:carbohydrate binding domain-containing protein [Anaerolineae bacterium]
MLYTKWLTKRKWGHLLFLFIAVAAIAGLLLAPGSGDVAAAADPEIVLENGFEDGTVQGWASRGDAVLEASTEAANSGDYSLKVTERTSGWHGPSLDVLGMLQKNAVYEVSAYVRLVEGQPASRLIVSMQRTPVEGDTAYEWIAPSAEEGVTDAEWVHLQGQYTFTTDVTGLVLYIESTNATAE